MNFFFLWFWWVIFLPMTMETVDFQILTYETRNFWIIFTLFHSFRWQSFYLQFDKRRCFFHRRNKREIENSIDLTCHRILNNFHGPKINMSCNAFSFCSTNTWTQREMFVFFPFYRSIFDVNISDWGKLFVVTTKIAFKFVLCAIKTMSSVSAI